MPRANLMDKLTTLLKKKSVVLALCVIALLVMYLVEVQVIFWNIQAGLYLTDEAFGYVQVPMMMREAMLLMVSILMLSSVMLPKTKILGAFSIGLILMALYLTGSIMIYWIAPNHYVISVGYGLLTCMNAAWLIQAWSECRQAKLQKMITA
jgi:hypothetical protein